MTKPKQSTLIDRLRDLIDSLFAPAPKPVPAPVRVRRTPAQPIRRERW